MSRAPDGTGEGESANLRYELWERDDIEGVLAEEDRLVRGLEADPAHGPTHIETIRMRGERAVTLHKLNRREDALREFEWVATHTLAHPDVAADEEEAVVARWRVGHSLHGLGRDGEALEVFTELERRFGGDPRFRDSQQIEFAATARRQILGLQLAEAHESGSAAAEGGDPERALAEFTRAREIALEHPEIGPGHRDTALMRAKRGEALRQLGRAEEALSEFAEVARIPPGTDPPEQLWLAARNHRAELHIEADDHAAALADLTWLLEAFSADPSFGPQHTQTTLTRWRRAEALGRLGRDREAVAETTRVVEALTGADGEPPSRDLPLARVSLARSLALVRRYPEAFDEAQRALAEAGAAGPRKDPEILDLARQLLASLGEMIPAAIAGVAEKSALAHTEERFAHAVEGWTETIELAARDRATGPAHPDTLAARRNLVTALLALGRDEAALAAWEQVRALDGSAAEQPLSGPLLPLSTHSGGSQREARVNLEQALMRLRVEP